MRRVLIVDDHASFRHMARRMLRDAGYLVVGEAADGASAIAEASMLKPDLILLDVQLPDRDGCEVARAITATDDAPTVVLISSREASDYGEKIQRCGALGFLSKTVLSGPALDTLLNEKWRAGSP